MCHHDATVAGIAPAALLVANAYHYLAVVSQLAQLGRLAPRDFSIISRDEDPFLSLLAPEPARYMASPRALAKSLLQPVLELLESGSVGQRSVRLMPQFVRGASIAMAPARP